MKKKALVFVTLMGIIILSSCSGSGTNYDALIDQLHGFKPYYSTSEHDYAFREAVGIWPKDDDTLNDLILNEDFFNSYIDKYGMYDLLERYNDHLYCAEDPSLSSLDSVVVRELNNRNVTVRDAICGLQAYKDLPTLKFTGSTIGSDHNAEGYYGGKEDEVKEEIVEGEFNDSSRDNEVYEDTRKKTTAINYYGDWMVEHEYGYKYDEGKYEWVDGEFVDELASWKQYSIFTISYCGNVMTRVNSESLDGINLEYKAVDGKVFTFEKDGIYYSQRITWLADDITIPTDSKATNNEDKNNNIENEAEAKMGFDYLVGPEIQQLIEAEGVEETIFTDGLYIVDITNPALTEAGAQIGDRIVSLNGENIRTSDEWATAASKYKPGDEATIVVSRNSENVTINTEFVKQTDLQTGRTTGEEIIEIDGYTILITYFEDTYGIRVQY